MFAQTFADTAAAVTNELQPTEGSIVVAGIVAALTLILAPSEGLIAVSGNTPSITRALAPSVGAIVVGGNAPAFTFARAPSEGLTVVSGQAPAVFQALLLAPTEGLIGVAGQVPALSFALAAGVGSVTVGGGTPTLQASLAPAEGNAVVLGYAPAVDVIQTPSPNASSGGYFEYGGGAAPRAKEDLQADRVRFGISLEAQGVISSVAAHQTVRLELDAQKRFEELERELEAKDIAWRAEYLTALNAERERMITAEIAERLHAKQREEEWIVLALLSALA